MKKRTNAGPAAAKAVLTAAAWSEADEALAHALQANARLVVAMGKLSRRVRRQRLVGLESTLTEVEAEAFLVRQGLTRAAKVRGVSMLGEIGTITAFDPAAHAPIKGKVSAGALVKIVTPGVGLAGKVLVRAEVRRARKGPTA